MSRCPTMSFQLSLISKWLVKHISTEVSFKITIRITHVNIDIRWPWIWNQYFYLGIWIDDRTNIIVLPSFQLATRLNSQNTYETEVINGLWDINLYTNIGISNWHNWSFGSTKMTFLLYFSSLHDYRSPNTWNTLVHTSRGEMERCETRASNSKKFEKRKSASTYKPSA